MQYVKSIEANHNCNCERAPTDQQITRKQFDGSAKNKTKSIRGDHQLQYMNVQPGTTTVIHDRQSNAHPKAKRNTNARPKIKGNTNARPKNKKATLTLRQK